MNRPEPHPFGSARQTRRQRRAAAKARQAWQEVERRRVGDPAGAGPSARSDTATPTGLRAPRPAPIPDDPTQEREVPAIAVAAAVIAATVAACVAVGAGAPVLGHGWRAGWFAGAAAVAAAAASWAWQHRDRLGPRLRTAAATAAVAVTVLFTWGAATTILVDGRPVVATSEQAQAWRMANELYADLQTMADYDELLAMSIPEAQADYDRFDPARRDLERLNRKWTARLGDLDGSAFVPAVESARDAAYWGAEAVDVKARLVVQTDTALDAQLVNHRTAYADFVLDAGRRLAEAAAVYDVSLTGVDAGPVE